MYYYTPTAVNGLVFKYERTSNLWLGLKETINVTQNLLLELILGSLCIGKRRSVRNQQKAEQ